MIIHSKPKAPKKEPKVPAKVIIPAPTVKEEPIKKVEEEQVSKKKYSDFFEESEI